MWSAVAERRDDTALELGRRWSVPKSGVTLRFPALAAALQNKWIALKNPCAILRHDAISAGFRHKTSF